MLITQAFVSLKRCDIPNIPETVLSVQFDCWFNERLKDSCSDLSAVEVAALKDGTLRALLSPCEIDCSAQAIKLTKPCKKTRFMLHSAAAWMGLRSYTDNHILYVMRNSEDDDTVFISRNKAIAKGAKKVIHHVRPVVRMRRVLLCDACDTRDDVDDLYISVYHRGIFCWQCLENGECHTDPDNCSKWESSRYL